MEARYDREEDILMARDSDEPIDHAEKIGPVIVHFTKEGKPVLFEILDAEESLSKILPDLLIRLERARLMFLVKPELVILEI